MMNKEVIETNYLIPNEKVWIWENIREYRVFLKGSSQGYVINEDGFLILKLCDGKKKVNEILEVLKREKNLNEGDIINIKNFIKNLISLGILNLKPTPLLKEKIIPIVGRKYTFEPIHATVELCDCCNLECIYCYRESSPSKKNFLKEPINFLSKLLLTIF